MLDQDTIAQQLALLAQYRRTLAHLLQQAAQYDGEVFAPPQTANGIAEASKEIQRIKISLREGEVPVEDEPNDDAPPSQPVVPPPASGDQITVGAIIGSTAVAIGAGAQATATVYQMPKLDPALHQLRAPVGDFVGREREIETLVQVLGRAASGGAAAAISGVRGMGGIGKTELAYAAAQRLATQFPDAQLLVELRGASDTPLIPSQALQTLIHAFEREAKLPDDPDQLKALYNALLAGKQALILADDARDAAQVRPLLPPSGCALLVTSRHRFSLPGMAAFDLGVLPPAEAEQLLLEICPRIGEQTSKLAQLCGYLPLALRVSASLLEANDTREVSHYLEQLAAERLKQLNDPDTPDDPQASVEASLRLSYDALEPAAQRVLGQLSVFPASFDFAAASAVVEGEVAELLELLRRRSLLDWDALVQRLSLHELVRVFATARLENADAVRLRHARHYAQVANRTRDLYHQGGASLLAGLVLFDQERVHIDLGWGWALERAGDQDADALLLAYANAMAYVGDLRYDTRRERIPQLEAQRATAQRLGRRGAEGAALGNLGIAYADLGDFRQAISFFEQHLDVAREIGDRRGEGADLCNLGLAYAYLGEARQAISFFEQVLVIAREIGDRRAEGNALGGMGLAYADLGDPRQAISFFEQHLDVAREIGDRRSEGHALSNLGNAYAALGDARRAIAFHEQALVIDREIGDRRGEGADLGNLGIAYADLGDAHQAITFYEQALVIDREIGDRRGDANASWNLGLALAKQGDLARATELMQVYVDYLSEIDHPDAEKRAAEVEQVRQRIASG